MHHRRMFRALVCLFLFLLTGCAAETAASSGRVEITLGAWVDTGGGLAMLADAFNESQDEVCVRVETYYDVLGSDASSADAGQVGEKIEASEVEDAPGQEPADAEEKGPDMKKTKKLNVEGMMCDHCVAHVTEALEGVEGVSHVKVSLKKGEATLKAEPTVTDDALVQAVKDAGYDATVAA